MVDYERLKKAKTPEETIEIIDDILDELSPVISTDLYFLKGDTLMGLERYDDAIETFGQALVFPDPPVMARAHNSRGFCYFKLKDFENAVVEFEEAKNYVADHNIILNLAMAYYLTHRKKESLVEWKKLYDMDHSNETAKEQIERIEMELKIDEKIKDTPFNSVQEAFLQADIYSEMGQYDKEIEVYELINEIMPSQPPAWNKQGMAYYHLGKYGEAISCYDKALKYNPNSSVAMFYKALAYMNMDDWEAAEKNLRNALEHEPENEDYLANYAVVLIYSGQYEESIAIADKILESNPKLVQVHLNKAFALDQLNRFDESLKVYDEALKIDSNNMTCWNNKGYALRETSRYDDALECYDKALELSPNDANVLKNKAITYKKMGDLDKAYKYYLEAKQFDPDIVDSFEDL